MKEVKDLQDEHRDYVARLEAANSKLQVSAVETGAKDRAAISEARKRLSQIQIELDASLDKVAALEREGAKTKEESGRLREEASSAGEAAMKLESEVARRKEENASLLRELEKVTDRSLRATSDAERLEREKKKAQHDFEQVEDKLRAVRRSCEDQLKSREAELEDLRRSSALERATTTRRHEEAQQSAIKTYLAANAKLKRRLGKAEENSARLEREYTLLLIKVAELEAERKELRMQLNFGLSDLDQGALGLGSNLRTLASSIMRDAEAEESTNEDDVALALAAVGA